MDEDLLTFNPTTIQNRIYTLRGLQVMLDIDLAQIYGVKSIRLREQVKRNIRRFPSDFMFQLNENEVDFMVSQNAIPSKKHLGGSLPWVFTEQGVSNLSSVLNSDHAIDTNIVIMRAFVEMRKFILNNAQLFQRIEMVENKQLTTDKKIDQILDALELRALKPKQGIFYNGQIFDAYIFVSDLIKSANESIKLIDNYIDETVLMHLTKRKSEVEVIIYTQKISRQLLLDIEKHNQQYSPIKITEFKQSHDRFLIIDNSQIYHFGASLKDLGKKWFAFSKFEIGAIDILNKL
ncbi:MAG: ORF6N domain-containing protein [Paludibacter sp.]